MKTYRYSFSGASTNITIITDDEVTIEDIKEFVLNMDEATQES